jgi:nucleotide-binding universal stress UspA family protein
MIQAAFAPVVTRLSIPCDAHLIVAPQDSSSIAAILLGKQAELGAAVLVVAPHGKAGLTEWWLGSVTKELLTHCPVPVAVVPPY